MNNNRKMNFQYILAFIFLILCLPVFGASILIAYVVENITASVICSASGVILAVSGIILACLSKEKKTEEVEDKTDVVEEKEENNFKETLDKI